MDPLTQGVVGATLAGAFAPKGLKRKALVAGFCGGMTADLDVLIRSDADPRLTAKPAPFSLLLWRTVYRHEDRYFVDALQVPFRGEARLYPGGSTPAQVFPEDFPQVPPDSRLYHDLARFHHFSDQGMGR